MRDSRPDGAFATSFLAKHKTNPTLRKFALLLRLRKYLAQNKLEIKLPHEHQPGALKIDAYVDAGMGNPTEVYGTTGWIITVNGYPTAWKSKKQQQVGRSSAKVEPNVMHN